MKNEYQGMTVSFEEVTPEDAVRYLANQAPNRNAKAKGDEYAHDMKADKWNPDSMIKFDTEGRMFDGQNRLKALAVTGRPQVFVVLRNAPIEYQRNTDNLTSRKAQDSFRIDGYVNADVLSKSLTWLADFRDPSHLYEHQGGGKGKVSINERYDQLEKDRGVADFTSAADKIRKTLGAGSAGMYAAAMYLTHAISPKDAPNFWDRLQDGQNLSEGDPRLAFRHYAKKAKETQGNVRSRSFSACLVKAWNAWAVGDKIQEGRLSFKAGGDSPEGYPTFRPVQ